MKKNPIRIGRLAAPKLVARSISGQNNNIQIPAKIKLEECSLARQQKWSVQFSRNEATSTRWACIAFTQKKEAT